MSSEDPEKKSVAARSNPVIIVNLTARSFEKINGKNFFSLGKLEIKIHLRPSRCLDLVHAEVLCESICACFSIAPC